MWKPLTSHLWRAHGIDMELFACDKCDYKTNSLSKLNAIHKLIHSNVKAFQVSEIKSDLRLKRTNVNFSVTPVRNILKIKNNYGITNESTANRSTKH